MSNFPCFDSIIRTIKLEVPLDSDDPAYQIFLLQYGERIEKLSQEDKLSKFFMQDF